VGWCAMPERQASHPDGSDRSGRAGRF
jgi:hypothetical protein